MASVTKVKVNGVEYDLQTGSSASTDFDQLSNRPSYGGVAMTHATNIPDLASYRTSAAQDTIDATKYEKPASGIPKTDLASDVQTSLGLADSALQEHQSLSAYRTASAQDSIDLSLQTSIEAKQAQNIQRTVTIAVADWNSGTTCTKTVSGVTATNTVIVDPSDANVEATAQATDSLTFTASATPTAAVTVKVVILP